MRCNSHGRTLFWKVNSAYFIKIIFRQSGGKQAIVAHKSITHPCSMMWPSLPWNLIINLSMVTYPTYTITVLAVRLLYPEAGPWFNIKTSSYQYRKSHCGDKTILRPSYLHNRISYTGKITSLYWIRALMGKNGSSNHGVRPWQWRSCFTI